MGRNFVARSNDWLQADAVIFPAVAVIAIAAFAKKKWMQRVAGLAYTSLTLFVFATVAVPQ